MEGVERLSLSLLLSLLSLPPLSLLSLLLSRLLLLLMLPAAIMSFHADTPQNHPMKARYPPMTGIGMV